MLQLSHESAKDLGSVTYQRNVRVKKTRNEKAHNCKPQDAVYVQPITDADWQYEVKYSSVRPAFANSLLCAVILSSHLRCPLFVGLLAQVLLLLITFDSVCLVTKFYPNDCKQQKILENAAPEPFINTQVMMHC